MGAAQTDYLDVTELAGDDVTAEQVARMHRRYAWVAANVRDLDVLEVACGTGQGAALIAASARSYVGIDTSTAMIERAKQHYASRLRFMQLGADSLSTLSSQFDSIVVCEALYYFDSVEQFFADAAARLRPGGQLLIVTANKDLFDFNPSPYSVQYNGVTELSQKLQAAGFDCAFFGDTPVSEVGLAQRLLRPIKAVASNLGLMPKTMAGKKLLKRLVFGSLVKMPHELTHLSDFDASPMPLAGDRVDRTCKVIYCLATRVGTAA